MKPKTVTIGGRKYRRETPAEQGSCEGCVAYSPRSPVLCGLLPCLAENNGGVAVIFVKVVKHGKKS